MKHIAKIAAFTAIFLIINRFSCGFMPPDNGSSFDMGAATTKSSPLTLPSLALSLASCALPEEDLAAATGGDRCTDGNKRPKLDMSQIALETLLREHSPRYVILVMDLTNMTGNPIPKPKGFFICRAADGLLEG